MSLDKNSSCARTHSGFTVQDCCAKALLASSTALANTPTALFIGASIAKGLRFLAAQVAKDQRYCPLGVPADFFAFEALPPLLTFEFTSFAIVRCCSRMGSVCCAKLFRSAFLPELASFLNSFTSLV